MPVDKTFNVKLQKIETIPRAVDLVCKTFESASPIHFTTNSNSNCFLNVYIIQILKAHRIALHHCQYKSCCSVALYTVGVWT